MRILVNDIAASEGGALSVLRDFYQYVRDFGGEHEWIFLLSDSYVEETDNIQVIEMPQIKKSRFKKIWFDSVSGSKIISSFHPEVVLNLQNIATAGVKVPQIVYVHQSIPFQHRKRFSILKSSERSLALVQLVIGHFIKRNLKYCNHVIVQTKWMKQALIDCTRLKEPQISVITPNVSVPSVMKHPDFNKNRFFYPTADEIYKNNTIINEAFRILQNRGVKQVAIQMTLTGTGPEPNIEYIGRITREQVYERYFASTLIFPSYIETFGLPLLEAKICNTVILASDCEFAHEILDDYPNAYFFDPFQATELANLMEKVIQGEICLQPVKDTQINVHNSWEDVVNICIEQTMK